MEGVLLKLRLSFAVAMSLACSATKANPQVEALIYDQLQVSFASPQRCESEVARTSKPGVFRCSNLVSFWTIQDADSDDWGALSHLPETAGIWEFLEDAIAPVPASVQYNLFRNYVRFKPISAEIICISGLEETRSSALFSARCLIKTRDRFVRWNFWSRPVGGTLLGQGAYTSGGRVLFEAEAIIGASGILAH